MNQREALQAMDADIFEAFGDISFTDLATYTLRDAPLTMTISCNVMVDRDVTIYGDDELPIVTGQTVVTFQRRELATEVGAYVSIGAETFQLRELVKQDESISVWKCSAVEVMP